MARNLIGVFCGDRNMLRVYFIIGLLSLIFGATFNNTALSQDKGVITYSIVRYIDVPGLDYSNIPEEYKNLNWHRFVTTNFEIMAIDYNHGWQISQRCEEIKSWIQHRWGLNDISYNKTCMILCIPNSDLFQNWLRKTDINPKVAKTKNLDNTDREVYAVWIAGDNGFLINTLPQKIGWVNILNYMSCYNVQIPNWAIIGMSALNNDVEQLRHSLSTLMPEGSYSASHIISNNNDSMMNDIEYQVQCTALCLMLRKYAGEQAFINVLKSSRDMSNVTAAAGYTSMTDLDVKFNTYCRNLSYDIRKGVAPKMAFTWFPSSKFLR